MEKFLELKLPKLFHITFVCIHSSIRVYYTAPHHTKATEKRKLPLRLVELILGPISVRSARIWGNLLKFQRRSVL